MVGRGRESAIKTKTTRHDPPRSGEHGGAANASSAIASEIEDSIREGRLTPGESLLPIRELAEREGVSAGTAARAYRILRQRGWLTADGRRGTRVSPGPPSARRTPAAVPAGVRNLADGNPDRSLLPKIKPALRRLDVEPLLYGAGLKSERLVRLARRQFERDGIDPEHLAVTSGALDAIERVLTARLRPGDRVVVEDPGFPGVIELVRSIGLVPVPVRVDHESLNPGALEEALGPVRGGGMSAVRALIVTPRAQNPTGLVITERRRRMLGTILARYSDLLLIEDDHAAGVAGADAVTLVRPKTPRWAVVRSVSKSLGPDLRLAVVAGDADTITAVEERQTTGMGWVSHILQELVAELWSSRDVKSLLSRAERTYSARREGLLRALDERGLRGFGASGMNVWIRVGAEAGILEMLRRDGWAAAPGERFRLRTAAAIRVTISTLEPRDAARFADALVAAIIPGIRSPSV